MSIQERFRKIIEHKQLTANSFASSINISPQRLGKYLKDRDPDYDTIKRILETFVDIDPDWLLTGKGEMLRPNNIQIADIEIANKFNLRTDNNVDIQRVPLYNVSATAGLSSIFTDSFCQVPDDYLSIPNVPLCDGAIYVVGDSMFPIIRTGDIILYKQIHNMDWGIAWGEMYIISFCIDGDEYVMVKYLKKSKNDNTIILASENPAYDPMEIPITSIRALAIVKASVRYNTMR